MGIELWKAWFASVNLSEPEVSEVLVAEEEGDSHEEPAMPSSESREVPPSPDEPGMGEIHLREFPIEGRDSKEKVSKNIRSLLRQQ